MDATFSKQAKKELKGMDFATKQRIRQGIIAIPQGDIKPIRGFSDGRLRLRIGKYRMVFIYTDQENNKGHIIEIGARGSIYK